MDASVFGLIVADLLAWPMDLRRPPEPGGLAALQSLQLEPGGNVCNVGTAMSRLGMTVAACGAVGNDALGSAILEKLKQEKLDISGVSIETRNQTSATVVAVEPGGERAFFHAPGVTSLLDASAFRRCFPIIKQSRWLHIGYFGLLPTLTPDLPALLQELKRSAPLLRIALDTSNPPARRELLDPILPHVDLFAPSRAEATALTGETDPLRACKRFRAQVRPDSIIAMKLDAEGCYVDGGKSSFVIPAYGVKVVDTTGAGDAWFGGMLTGLIRGLPLSDCGRLANRAAADCCTSLGASAGIRSFDDTISRL